MQNEKSQLQNKEAAFRVLKAKLYEREEQKRQEELAELRGDRMDNTLTYQSPKFAGVTVLAQASLKKSNVDDKGVGH